MEEYENVIKQARKGMHDAVCKYLIGGGVADPLPEWPKTLTCTLMQCALQACRVDIAEVLLKYGAKTTTVFNKSYFKYFPFKKNSTMKEKEHVLRFLVSCVLFSCRRVCWGKRYVFTWRSFYASESIPENSERKIPPPKVWRSTKTLLSKRERACMMPFANT
jgi:hypothetical protein